MLLLKYISAKIKATKVKEETVLVWVTHFKNKTKFLYIFWELFSLKTKKMCAAFGVSTLWMSETKEHLGGPVSPVPFSKEDRDKYVPMGLSYRRGPGWRNTFLYTCNVCYLVYLHVWDPETIAIFNYIKKRQRNAPYAWKYKGSRKFCSARTDLEFP